MVDTIERFDLWHRRYDSWKAKQASGSIEKLDQYPFVENSISPFTALRRSLPMLNLAVITSAGAYIDGTEPFDTNASGGDPTFREIPSEINLSDLRFSVRGYDPSFVQQDPNVEVPLDRLSEFRANRIIGQFNSAFWSFCGFAPDAGLIVDQMLPKLILRLTRYEVQAAFLIPASRLCHQSVALVARGLESAGIPTVMLGVERELLDGPKPPRGAFYAGKFGSVAGSPNWPEHQRRVLDEALRWLESFGEPGVGKLSVGLESQVEAARGER
jgi:D-proline reductase (dithiol) PrdB